MVVVESDSTDVGIRELEVNHMSNHKVERRCTVVSSVLVSNGCIELILVACSQCCDIETDSDSSLVNTLSEGYRNYHCSSSTILSSSLGRESKESQLARACSRDLYRSSVLSTIATLTNDLQLNLSIVLECLRLCLQTTRQLLQLSSLLLFLCSCLHIESRGAVVDIYLLALDITSRCIALVLRTTYEANQCYGSERVKYIFHCFHIRLLFIRFDFLQYPMDLGSRYKQHLHCALSERYRNTSKVPSR